MDYKKINEEFYSKNYWGIDRSEHKWFSKYVKVKVLGKFMKPLNRGAIYDAGGGVGNYGWFFGRKFKEVIVSDISELSLKRIPEKNIKKLNCSVLENDLPDNSIDCVLLIDVFEHIDKKDLLKMMVDLKRILKPDGRILIFTSHFGWGLGAPIQRMLNPQKRLLGDEHKEGHVNRLKYNEFRELFKRAELKIDSYYFYSIIFQQLTDKIKDSFAKIASFILNRKSRDAQMSRAGQSVKEDLRKKETSIIFKIPLALMSYISYLDILIFGKWFPGNSIFFSLRK